MDYTSVLEAEARQLHRGPRSTRPPRTGTCWPSGCAVAAGVGKLSWLRRRGAGP